jgi:hypothetical protein
MRNKTATAGGIPPTSAYTIVFPSPAFDAKFDSSSYYPTLTDGKASTQEITQVLSDIESTIKPFNEKIKRAGYIFLLYVILSFLPALYFFFAKGDKSVAFIVSIAAFCAGAIVGLVIWICCYIRKVDAKMLPKCQEAIDRHNQDFAQKGLRWHLPPSFPRWVELWKDYKRPQGVGIRQSSQNMLIPMLGKEQKEK